MNSVIISVVSTFQTRTAPSSEDVTSRSPVGENARSRIVLTWAGRIVRISPMSARCSATVKS